MAAIYHGGAKYGGGSLIEPNPQGTPANDLESIGIDGVPYSIVDTDAIHSSDIGVASGVAELDVNGKVPSSQLPSFVDDVIEAYYDSVSDRFYEESTFTTLIPPESGKTWVDIPANKSYRWTGSVYVRTDEGVQLGETSDTAYRGDRGKIAYDHSQSDHSGIKPAFTEASTRANIASGETIATILGKIKKWFSDLKTVAFTGAYSDLSGTPTIPTVNNGTLTIQKNGTQVATFTANQSGNSTANITVPTKVSDLTDDVVNGHYLPLTGGTLTGILNVSGSSDTPLYVRGNSQGAYIGFHNANGGTTYGYYGVKNDNKPYFYANNTSNRIAFISDITDEKVTATVAEPSSETVYDLLTVPHSSQTTNQKPSVNTDSKAYIKQGTAGSAGWVYLSAGNDTPTGTAGNKYGALRLYSEKNGYVDLATNAASTNGRAIRFPDASGTVALTNGTVAMAQQHWNVQTVDLSALDESTFYPVTGTPLTYDNGYVHMVVHVALNSGTVPSWSTHQRGFSVFLDILNEAGGWGTTQARGICLANGYTWCNSAPCGYSQMSNSSTPVFWCRGGGAYHIYSSSPITWTIRTSSYTASNQTVAPRSDNPGVVFNVLQTIYANLNGSAYFANELNNYYTSRPTSANVASDGKGGIRKFLATYSMTTGKPMNDGHIVQLDWDNGSTYASQLFVPADSTEHMQFRCQGSGTWSNWFTLIDSNNISSQSVDKATKDGDGNTISSTYYKKTDKPSTGWGNSGSATALATGYRDITSITIDKLGIYLITAWAEIDGGNGNKAVLITDGNNTAYAQNWRNESLSAGYPVQYTCNYFLSLTSDSSIPKTVKARVYTTYNNSSSIKGGITAVRVL